MSWIAYIGTDDETMKENFLDDLAMVGAKIGSSMVIASKKQ